MAKPHTSSDHLAAVQLLLCCTLLVAFAAPTATAASAPAAPSPAKVNMTWDVEYILWAPDCQQRVMVGINGKFPGPTITARAGDVVRVTVNNKLHTEGLVIHWHGMRQVGTPWADGTASISQCAINPGDSFTYEFVADKPGTFFYHGHFGMQRAAGLYGSLIVNATAAQDEPYRRDYDGGELNVLLSDWYHENVYAQAAGLERKDKHFEWIGEPQTILINGRGQYECMLGKVTRYHRGIDRYAKTCVRGKEAKLCRDEERCLRRSECGPYCPESQCAPVVFDVEPGKTYRLRIASTTTLSALNLQVQGHELTVVEADGNPVEPFKVTDIDIYSGESYSVLLTTSQKPTFYRPGAFWISVGVRGRHPKTLPATAVLRYTNSKFDWPGSAPPETPAWDDIDHSKSFTYRIKALRNNAITKTRPPRSSALNRTIVMLNTQTMVGGHVRWAINNVSLALPATPYLGAYHYGLQGSAFDAAGEAPDGVPEGYNVSRPPGENEGYAARLSDRVYELPHGALVDVVLQNADMMRERASETHPWHLHGHDFWVLGYGDGRYDAGKDLARLNMEDPPLRNTVVVFPHGWTALRFVADNTGAWAFHCHIEPHLHMGMGAVFVEGVEKMRELKVPREAMMCGVISTSAAVVTPAAPRTPAPAP
ncbi:L-ascorbate oxidase-like [Lolium rigidum]|uniref:L-ascorbate oxidase-like n=1 Tax=Lolium rigidum TaxID=89674 RepID=UPI001F5DDA6E|nr:L-ascorbate oxidase-like [Lolium rigidum]